MIVYPRLEPLPRWRLPAAQLEGSHASPGPDAADDAAGDHGPAVRPGRQHEPDPLEEHGPPWRDPGQGVRPRADRRRLDRPRPPARRSRPAVATSRPSRSPSGRPPRSPTRRSRRTGPSGMTVNVGRTAFLPPDRGSRQHLKIMQLLAAVEADGDGPAGRDADRDGRPAPARDDRGDHHAVARSVLGPPAGRAAGPGRRLCRVVAGRRGLRAPPGGPGGQPASAIDARGRGGHGQAGPRAPPRPRRVRADRPTRSPRAVRSARSWPDDRIRPRRRPPAPDPGRGLGHGGADRRAVRHAGLVDRRRALGAGSGRRYLDFLPVVAAGGVLVGFIGPKVGWGRWTTYLVGAVLAALIVPLFSASIAFPRRGLAAASCTGRPRRLSSAAYGRHRHPQPGLDHPVHALPAQPGPVRVGEPRCSPRTPCSATTAR